MTQVLGPQLALAAGLVAALSAGAVGRPPKALLRALALGAVLAALAWAASLAPGAEFGPLLRLDALGRSWQLVLYAGAVPLAFLLSVDDEVPTALFLGCALGMGLLAASRSLLMLFIGLELMSLPAYLLVARGGRSRAASREAAVKYFFAGCTGGAFYLLGMALHYAGAGTLDLAPAAGPLGEAGLALMGAAALFKLGAVPLHFWLPDAYEAAAPELAGFLSTSMKAAAVLLLMRLAALSPHSALAAALPAAGAASMLVGSVLALRQEKLQRLLAYSSISHAGYLVLGVGAWAAQGARPEGAVAVLFYLAAYVFMSNGAFAFVGASGVATRAELKGLAAREPVKAGLFAAVLLALGGVPPTGGFLAKLLVLWDALKAGLNGAAAVGALAALISLGYYLGLVRDVWFEAPGSGPSAEGRRDSAVVLLACAAASVALGLLAPWALGGLK